MRPGRQVLAFGGGIQGFRRRAQGESKKNERQKYLPCGNDSVR